MNGIRNQEPDPDFNRFEGRLASVSARDGYAVLEVGRGRLHARSWSGARRGARAAVRIRPEDVLLCADPPGAVSARNVLAGRVTGVRRAGGAAFVAIEAGLGSPLTALVTPRALRDLEIARGRLLFALVKATAIVPEATAPAAVRLRVSVEGRRATITPAVLDLVAATGRTGSLTLAALARRVPYRTAWRLVTRANGALEGPLLVLEKGGAGGGGAVLTPLGRALTAVVEAAERAIARG